jgi:hypothetical protein
LKSRQVVPVALPQHGLPLALHVFCVPLRELARRSLVRVVPLLLYRRISETPVPAHRVAPQRFRTVYKLDAALI